MYLATIIPIVSLTAVLLVQGWAMAGGRVSALWRLGCFVMAVPPVIWLVMSFGIRPPLPVDLLYYLARAANFVSPVFSVAATVRLAVMVRTGR